MTLVITLVYAGLLGWGFFVGVCQIYQGWRRPGQLLNPLLSHPVAIRLFTVHIIVVSTDLFVVGPWAVENKSTLWYWGGRIALLLSSLPIAAYFNRTPQSFGPFIGRWVRLRNFFEYGVHVLVAVWPVNWFWYYVLLWWLVAYRYLDVGPRRALQKLYNTPDKRAARPWAEYFNWGIIVTIYVLAFLAVYHQQILFADVPSGDLAPHVPARWEIAVVVVVNFVIALYGWASIRRYTDSLAEPGKGVTAHPVSGH